MDVSVAILGAGAMGEALCRGLLRAGWDPDDLVMAARREERAREAEERTGVRTVLDPGEAAEGREVVVVSVKPRDVPRLLDQITGHVGRDQVLVSVAAGVPTEVYEHRLPGVAVVRAMPNTPAFVGEGIAAYCPGQRAGQEALERAATVLRAVGPVVRLDEGLFDAVTAVSGTGPGYVFLLAEALIEAAVREGIPRDIAEELVAQTVRGAGALLVESGRSAFELRGQVTSPGGTTAAAVHVLEERGFRALVEDAVRAAAGRAGELGDQVTGRGAGEGH